VRPLTAAAPELLLESSLDTALMRPLGRITEDGSRPAIDKWEHSGKGPVPLVGARSWGAGRVVVVGSWKLCTVEIADNGRFLRNTIDWLRRRT
jgi:hypothetical protein